MIEDLRAVPGLRCVCGRFDGVCPARAKGEVCPQPALLGDDKKEGPGGETWTDEMRRSLSCVRVSPATRAAIERLSDVMGSPGDVIVARAVDFYDRTLKVTGPQPEPYRPEILAPPASQEGGLRRLTAALRELKWEDMDEFASAIRSFCANRDLEDVGAERVIAQDLLDWADERGQEPDDAG